MSQDRSQITDSNHPDWPQYKAEGHGHTDEQIRADLHAFLQSEGTQHAQLDLEVSGGVVTIGGDLASDDPLFERIRAIPSVGEVRTRAG